MLGRILLLLVIQLAKQGLIHARPSRDPGQTGQCPSTGLPSGGLRHLNVIHEEKPRYRLDLQHKRSGYVPGHTYTIYIRAQDPSQTFGDVLLSVSSESRTCQHGNFSILPQYYYQPQGCDHMVLKNTREFEHTFTFQWTAPTCGCVNLRARVKSADNIFYLDNENVIDGYLTKRMCRRHMSTIISKISHSERENLLCHVVSSSDDQIANKGHFLQRRKMDLNLMTVLERDALQISLRQRVYQVQQCCILLVQLNTYHEELEPENKDVAADKIPTLASNFHKEPEKMPDLPSHKTNLQGYQPVTQEVSPLQSPPKEDLGEMVPTPQTQSLTQTTTGLKKKLLRAQVELECCQQGKEYGVGLVTGDTWDRCEQRTRKVSKAMKGKNRQWCRRYHMRCCVESVHSYQPSVRSKDSITHDHSQETGTTGQQRSKEQSPRVKVVNEGIGTTDSEHVVREVIATKDTSTEVTMVTGGEERNEEETDVDNNDDDDADDQESMDDSEETRNTNGDEEDSDREDVEDIEDKDIQEHQEYENTTPAGQRSVSDESQEARDGETSSSVASRVNEDGSLSREQHWRPIKHPQRSTDQSQGSTDQSQGSQESTDQSQGSQGFTDQSQGSTDQSQGSTDQSQGSQGSTDQSQGSTDQVFSELPKTYQSNDSQFAQNSDHIDNPQSVETVKPSSGQQHSEIIESKGKLRRRKQPKSTRKGRKSRRKGRKNRRRGRKQITT